MTVVCQVIKSKAELRKRNFFVILRERRDYMTKKINVTVGLFGQRVKMAQERLGLSQRKLVEAVNAEAAIALALEQGKPAGNLAHSALSRIESGRLKVVNSETLANLATALRTDPMYLLGRTDHPEPSDVIAHDKTARKLFEYYERLDPKQKDSLVLFAKFMTVTKP